MSKRKKIKNKKKFTKLKIEKKKNKFVYLFLLFFFEEPLVLEDVAIKGSGSASGDFVVTLRTTGSSGCVGATNGVVTGGGGGGGGGGADGVGIGGSVESGGLIRLSMMRERYRSSSMLYS